MSFKQFTENSYGGTTGGNSVVLTVPSSTLENDLMVAIISTDDNTPAITITPPSGWTIAPETMPITGVGAVSDPAVWIYTRDASAGDETGAGTDTYTWSFSGAEEQAGLCILLDPGVWGQFATNVLTGTGTTIDSPTITTQVDDEVVFFGADKDNPVVFTGTPGGVDAVVNNDGYGPANDGGAATAVARQEYPTALTATGTKQWTLAVNERQGWTFSIEPTATATWEQEGYRWRDDNGTEITADWLLAQDTSPLERNAGLTTRLRMLLDATGDPPTEQVTIQFKRDDEAAGEWRDI
jgi:hypothetical protein